jgi:hypothetical protein
MSALGLAVWSAADTALAMKPPPRTLARRNTVFAVDQFNFMAGTARTQPAGLRRPRGADLHEDFHALVGQRLFEFAVTDPVDVAQRDAMRPQSVARADHHLPRTGVEPHHVKRLAGCDTKPLPLADGEMDNAAMAAERCAVEVDDIAGFRRAGLEPLDHLRIVAGWHETDVLAVVLVGHREAEAPCELTRFGLAALAEGKPQNVELLGRGAEQEIALVALFLARAI